MAFPSWIQTPDAAVVHWLATHAFDGGVGHILRFMSTIQNAAMGIIAIAIIILAERRFKGVLVIAHVILAVGITEFTSSQLMKPALQRPRPCATQSFPGNPQCGDQSPSFPSSHASNSMAVAISALHYSPFYGTLLVAFSFVNGFSRVYLGLHYPTDVIAGWILGGLIAYLIRRLLIRFGFRGRSEVH